jgi:hypothetical protein
VNRLRKKSFLTAETKSGAKAHHLYLARNGTTKEAAEKVIFAAEKPQGLKPYRIFNVLRHD